MILSGRYVSTVREIIRRFVPDAHVFLVGSRARGNPKPFSDIDLLFVAPPRLEPMTRARLRIAFDESDLPFKVDLIEWAAVSPQLRERLMTDAVELMGPQTRADNR